MDETFDVCEYSLLQYTTFGSVFVKYSDIESVLYHISSNTGDMHFRITPTASGIYLFRIIKE